jgi:CTP synthase
LTVGITGKYVTGTDTYLSVHRSIEHAAYSIGKGVKIIYIDSENPNEAKEKIDLCDAVVIPGGFGSRGTEGMINIASYCRYNKIPTLGICLGMQIMCIESSRRVLGDRCVSIEALNDHDNPKDYHIIIIPMADLNKELGGTMRLGTYTTNIHSKNTLLYKCYKGVDNFNERHRHRNEVNPSYISSIERGGLVMSGKNDTIGCIDVVEDNKHPFYIGCQYHPEFKSSNDNPSILFVELIKSTCVI